MRQVFSVDNPNNRPDVVDLIILIAGGEPASSAEDESDDLKTGGVGIFVIGSTEDISEATLKGFSSGQQAINKEYWLLLTFDSLDSIVLSVGGELVDLVCEGLPRAPEDAIPAPIGQLQSTLGLRLVKITRFPLVSLGLNYSL